MNNIVNIKLQEEDAAALADLMDRISEFNSYQGPHLLPNLEFALKQGVENGYLKFEEAFDMFGLISQLASQIALRSENIWRVRQSADEALDQVC